MTDRYENIRKALADMDAAAEARNVLAWRDAHARFVVHVPPDTIQALLEERDALREVLGRILANEAPDWKFAEEFGGYVLYDDLREEARAALEYGGEDA